MTTEQTARVEVYSGRLCAYCKAAKRLLDKLGVEYEEIMTDSDPALREKMVQRSGRQTIPQIFINDFHVGGYDDLAEMHAEGKLTKLLGIE